MFGDIEDKCKIITLIFQDTELLRVRVVKAERLSKRDIFGVCDPYAVILLKRDGNNVAVDKAQTKTRRKVYLLLFMYFFYRIYTIRRNYGK